MANITRSVSIATDASEEEWDISNGVSVKNTFIDVVVHRRKKGLQRHSTEPAYITASRKISNQEVINESIDESTEYPTAQVGGWRTPSLLTQVEEEIEEGSEEQSRTPLYEESGSERTASKRSEVIVEEATKWKAAPAAAGQQEEVTTMMMRNLPNKYKRQMLLEEIEEAGFLMSTEFDFFYLPMDHRRDANLGYCFLNFVTPEIATRFEQVFEGTKLKHHVNSNKTIVITPALIQGYEANRSFLESSSVKTDKQREYRPAFVTPSKQQQAEKPPRGRRNQDAGPSSPQSPSAQSSGTPPPQASSSPAGGIAPQWMGLSTSPPLSGVGSGSPVTAGAMSQILAPFLYQDNPDGSQQEMPSSPPRASGQAAAEGPRTTTPPEGNWLRPTGAPLVGQPPPGVLSADWASWPASPFGLLEGLERTSPGSPSAPRMRAPPAINTGVAMSPQGSGVTRGHAVDGRMHSGAQGAASPASTVAAAERKLFVGGVPRELGEEDLYTVFAQFGKVKKAWLQRGRDGGQPAAQEGDGHRGFGFVVFNDKESLDRILGRNRSQFILLQGGKKLEVKRAVRSKDVLAGRRSDRPQDDQEPDSPTSPKSLGGDGEATTSSVQGQKVFVGGIPQEMGQEDLYSLFSKFGNVKKTWLQVQVGQGEEDERAGAARSHRGFGFVIFHDGKSVHELLGDRASHFLVLEDGRRLEVKRAVKSRGGDRVVTSPAERARPDANNSTPVAGQSRAREPRAAKAFPDGYGLMPMMPPMMMPPHLVQMPTMPAQAWAGAQPQYRMDIVDLE